MRVDGEFHREWDASRFLMNIIGGAPGGMGDARAGGLGNPGGNKGGGSGQGRAGGMSPSLLDAKYPGAKKKKSRQYEASAANLAKVGTILGGLVGGPAASAVAAGYSALTGDLSVEGALDPFSGRMADVPSVGAGYADSGKKDEAATVTGLTATRKKKTTKPKSPLGSVGTILAGAGGSLVSGGL
jgi:hypothetical protein